MPSESAAIAVSTMVAGAEKELPLIGEVKLTVGRLFRTLPAQVLVTLVSTKNIKIIRMYFDMLIPPTFCGSIWHLITIPLIFLIAIDDLINRGRNSAVPAIRRCYFMHPEWKCYGEG